LSSLTNITLRNGNEEKFGGKANLSATGFGLNLEGPINDKGSFLLSARRSYLDLIFNAAGFGFVPEYWDFQGKVNYSADNKNIFTLLSVWALGSVKLNNDDADNRLDNSRVAVPNQRQYFSGLTWKHLFDKGFTTVTLGRNYTNFSTFQNDSSEVPKEIFRNDSEEGELILRTDLDLQLAERTELRIGNQVKYGAALDYDINLPGYLRRDENGEPRPLLLDTTFNTYKNGTYASLTLPLSDHRVTFGGRMDYYSYTGNKFFFSPRASFSYYINPVSSIIGSAGRYYQAPSYVWLIGGAREALEPVIADQVVLGYDHTPTQDVKVQLEVFYKWYDNYPARIFRPQAVLAPAGFDDITGDIPFGLEPLASRGDGLSRGAELFIQKKLSNIPVYGLLSLSYSETKFTSLDGVKRWGAFDSRWVFNIAGGWRVSPDWEISGKFRIATGVPTTPYTEDGRLDFTRYNEGERLPLFHSFDFRADKKWNFVGWSLVTYIDVQNVYGRENISGIKWNPRLGEPEFQKSIGVLPSIGVSFEF
ncbi:MAG: TonB-dependent receptor plug domain-containing protein, partial [Bacteroidota bacterium]